MNEATATIEPRVPNQVQCRMCKEMVTVHIRMSDWREYNSPNRPKVQDIFPYLSAAERELFVSQTCGKCWDKMFKNTREW